MNRIKSYDEKAMQNSTKISAAIAGLALVIMGLFSTVKYSLIVGIVLLLATFMKKQVYITEKGLEIVYKLLIINHSEKWAFNSISDIHKEAAPDSRYQVLHFMKGAMSRRVVFLKDDANIVIRLALEENQSIHFTNINNELVKVSK